MPCGSKRVNVNTSTNSSSGTPCCRPRLIEIARQLSMLRKAAPSLCMSMKISPSDPSSYSPVRTYTLWPATFASTVNPPRLRGRRRRGVTAGAVIGASANGAAATTAFSFFLSEVERGWLSLQPSRYRATAFRPSFHDSM